MRNRDKEVYPSGLGLRILSAARIEEHVFAAFLDGEKDPIIDPVEHNDWKWCTFDEAIELLRWVENIEALKQVQSYLNDKSI